MDINIISSFFIFNTANMVLIGSMINFLDPYVPAALKRSFLYGKFSTKTPHVILTKLEVPKSNFRHMYIFSAPALAITLCSILYMYIYNANVPEIIIMLLDTLLGTSRKPLISTEVGILTLIIFNIHAWKRLYETCYVNVFSNQKMHIYIYFLGLLHYAGLILSIIGEIEGFVRGSYRNENLPKVTIVKLVCTFICLWSSYMQLKTTFILAKLRRNTNNDIVSLEYKIPSEGLFKHIAAPLQFYEILIYVMLSIILWQAYIFHYVTLWVVVNQVRNNSTKYIFLRRNKKD
ncbi:hypothetical protein PUN28_010318 [Cardiocondyla obscurior]|uniref:Polyprenal reductase n=1 Tax=Cardiocondyla obscurior TaxID=286306 RepID=A0AAW2FNN9_9HYME